MIPFNWPAKLLLPQIRLHDELNTPIAIKGYRDEAAIETFVNLHLTEYKNHFSPMTTTAQVQVFQRAVNYLESSLIGYRWRVRWEEKGRFTSQ